MVSDLSQAIETANKLREAGINTEVYFDDKNTYVYGYEANRKDFRKNLKKMIVYLESFTKSSGL